nr:preprotein translocase subunit SecE [Halovenus salina]
MQVTFITSIVAGAPIVALLSTFVTLETWPERAQFAAGTGAVLWFVIAVSVFFYARRKQRED